MAKKQELENKIKEFFKKNNKFPTRAQLAEFIGTSRENVCQRVKRNLTKIKPTLIEREENRNYTYTVKRKYKLKEEVLVVDLNA